MEDDTSTSVNMDDVTASLSRITMEDVAEKDADVKHPRSLLDLPPEIWSRICKLAVVEHRTIELLGGGDKKGFQDKVVQPPITRVCTTIRNETIASFYSLNTFLVWDVDDNWSEMFTFKAWSRAIGATHKRNLKHLYVRTEHVYELRRHLSRMFKKCELRVTSPVVHRDEGCGYTESTDFHLTFATSQGIVLERVSDDMKLHLENGMRQNRGFRPLDRI